MLSKESLRVSFLLYCKYCVWHQIFELCIFEKEWLIDGIQKISRRAWCTLGIHRIFRVLLVVLIFVFQHDATLLPRWLYIARLHNPIDHFHVDVEITKEDNNVAQKQPKCNLHSWYSGKNRQSRYKVMHCMKCDINLCIHYYKLFNTEPNLEQIKELLKQAYNCNHTKKY